MYRKNRARTAQGEEVEESSSSDNDDDDENDENDEKDENDNENGTNAGYMCDEEIFVNRPKDQFQKQYRKYVLMLPFLLLIIFLGCTGDCAN